MDIKLLTENLRYLNFNKLYDLQKLRVIIALIVFISSVYILSKVYMKNLKFTVLICVVIGLAACNSGTDTSSDVQTFSTSNNGTNIAITATGCQTISPNGGTCDVSIDYSTSNSVVVDTPLVMNTPTTYNNNTNSINQCQPFSTKNKNCTITITSQSSTSSPLPASIYSQESSTTVVNFTVGGGI